ncbi:MAG: family 43 glycosylhydrolase [Clostridia bacterium]|nr:family 43 glycosylhydrolase [Clostridia bacterium]
MKYIAHRGASLIKQENTVESLVCGAELGAFAVECDIRMTADGRFIIFHDPDLARIAGSNARIKEKTFDEICAIVRENAGYTPITVEDIAERYHESTPILLHIKICATDALLDTLKNAPFPFICGIEHADDVKKYREFLPPERILSFIPSPELAADFLREGAGIIRLWEHWLENIKPADIRAIDPSAEVWIMANRDGSMNGAPESLEYITSLGADGVLLNDIVMGMNWKKEHEMTSYRNPICEGADPFILLHEGKYYHYATNAPDGYLVYESDDLVHWENRGYCLRKEDVQGDKWFWAPEIMHRNGKFYMIYTSDEHIGIAVADSPLGPFKQEKQRFLSERNAIDGDFFTDDDGQIYLYYVRFTGGNVIHGARLDLDTMTLDEENEVRLIAAEEEWETHMGRVAEGPFMLKHNGRYYLTYSANDYRSIDYAIGYAVSESPLGPFVKYEGNPILHRNENVNGVGHHSFTYSKDGKQMICVYHRHRTMTEIHPRTTCIDKAWFDDDGVLHIDGPTTEEMVTPC